MSYIPLPANRADASMRCNSCVHTTCGCNTLQCGVTLEFNCPKVEKAFEDTLFQRTLPLHSGYIISALALLLFVAYPITLHNASASPTIAPCGTHIVAALLLAAVVACAMLDGFSYVFQRSWLRTTVSLHVRLALYLLGASTQLQSFAPAPVHYLVIAQFVAPLKHAVNIQLLLMQVGALPLLSHCTLGLLVQNPDRPCPEGCFWTPPFHCCNATRAPSTCNAASMRGCRHGRDAVHAAIYATNTHRRPASCALLAAMDAQCFVHVQAYMCTPACAGLHMQACFRATTSSCPHHPHHYPHRPHCPHYPHHIAHIAHIAHTALTALNALLCRWPHALQRKCCATPPQAWQQQ